MKDFVSTAFKGLCVGGTMLVPGVSGGSMAMILGIYDRLVSSVSSFFKSVKENVIFLGIFCVGALIGMVLFAKPLLQLIERFPLPMMYLFIGAVIGGIPLIYKEAGVKQVTIPVMMYMIIGAVFVMLFGMLPGNLLNGGSNAFAQTSIMVIAGIFAAIALILPGISISYVLLLMGIYDTVMEAISTLQIAPLLPMAVGLVLGIVLTARILEKAMKNYTEPTYMIILGFVIGSVAQVFPGFPKGFEWAVCLLTLAAGYVIIQLISKAENVA